MPLDHVQGLFSVFRLRKTPAEMIIGGPIALERTEKYIRQSIAPAPRSRNQPQPAPDSTATAKEAIPEEEAPKPKKKSKSKSKKKSGANNNDNMSWTTYLAMLTSRSKRKQMREEKKEKKLSSEEQSDREATLSLELELQKRRENWMENGYNNYVCVPTTTRSPSTAARRDSQVFKVERISNPRDSNPQFARLGRHLSHKKEPDERHHPNAIPRTMPSAQMARVEESDSDSDDAELQKDYDAAAEWVHAQMMAAEGGYVVEEVEQMEAEEQTVKSRASKSNSLMTIRVVDAEEGSMVEAVRSPGIKYREKMKTKASAAVVLV